MTFPLALNQSDYETLVAYARKGTLNPDGTINQDSSNGLEAWLRDLEKRNGITRYAVWVQWQEQDAPLPVGTIFPDKWPPELRQYIALVTRPIARSDVDKMLAEKARKPTSVLVTRDPAARVGWTEIDFFFR